jgi:hypothetical protein
MGYLSNRTVRVCAVISIRIDARIQLVGNVIRVRAYVGRACRSAAVVHVGVKTGVQLVASVGAVRTIVCRCGVGGVQVLAISVCRCDACAVASSVVAMFNLVGTIRRDSCVLSHAYAVPCCLVNASVEVATDGLASSLLRISMQSSRCSAQAIIREPGQRPS